MIDKEKLAKLNDYISRKEAIEMEINSLKEKIINDLISTRSKFTFKNDIIVNFYLNDPRFTNSTGTTAIKFNSGTIYNIQYDGFICDNFRALVDVNHIVSVNDLSKLVEDITYNP